MIGGKQSLPNGINLGYSMEERQSNKITCACAEIKKSRKPQKGSFDVCNLYVALLQKISEIIYKPVQPNFHGTDF